MLSCTNQIWGRRATPIILYSGYALFERTNRIDLSRIALVKSYTLDRIVIKELLESIWNMGNT